MGCQTSVDSDIQRADIRRPSPSPGTRSSDVEFWSDSVEKSVVLNVPQNGGSSGEFTLRYGILSHKGFYPDDLTKPNQVIKKHC